jgi:hypothetical protein
LDGLIFVFFPIAGDTAANPDYAGHLAGVCCDEPVIEPDRLREADQQAALRSGTEPIAEGGQRLLNHIVVQPDRRLPMRADAPVVNGDRFGIGEARIGVVLVRRLERGYDVLLAEQSGGEPEHGFRTGAIAM